MVNIAFILDYFMKNNALITEYSIRFRSLFENKPEIILYQNLDFKILDADPAFLQMVAGCYIMLHCQLPNIGSGTTKWIGYTQVLLSGITIVE